jgi:hypothetical protein
MFLAVLWDALRYKLSDVEWSNDGVFDGSPQSLVFETLYSSPCSIPSVF